MGTWPCGWPAGWQAGRHGCLAGCLAPGCLAGGQHFAHVFEKGAKFAAEGAASL